VSLLRRRTEPRDEPGHVEPRERRLQHQRRRVAAMARSVQHRDEAARRMAEYESAIPSSSQKTRHKSTAP
jgi:hypothetical protein